MMVWNLADDFFIPVGAELVVLTDHDDSTNTEDNFEHVFTYLILF